MDTSYLGLQWSINFSSAHRGVYCIGLAKVAASWVSRIKAALTLAAAKGPGVFDAIRLPEGGIVLHPVQWPVRPAALSLDTREINLDD